VWRAILPPQPQAALPPHHLLHGHAAIQAPALRCPALPTTMTCSAPGRAFTASARMRSPSRGRPWLRARTVRQYLGGAEGRAGGGSVSGGRDREGGSRRASGEREGEHGAHCPGARVRRLGEPESGDGSHSYLLVWPSARLGEQRDCGRVDLSLIHPMAQG
jgi:hypothetical protein